jgi:hypothetical protein
MTDHKHSAEYDEYMQSDEWRELCKRLANKCKHHCQICGAHKRRLSGHHLTYERLGHELDEDIQMVCFDCHPWADSERVRRIKEARWVTKGWVTLEEVDELTMKLVSTRPLSEAARRE